jgi:arabinogalactan endo-1,4-beta-galactosidase
MKKNLLTMLMIAFAIAASAQRYAGGDISLLTKYEEHGARYYDSNGNAISDMLTFFKNEGMNAMRVRLFVDPSVAPSSEKGEGVCQDLEYVKALGKRIKDAGFKLMLDFHYSDSWADPAKQYTPAAWATLTDAQLQSKIYEYTADVLQQMKDFGAAPDFIQTGNEISYGMMWAGRSAAQTTWKKYYAGQSANAERFFSLLKKAGEACREKCPDAKIIIHTERVAKTDYLDAFYNDMKTAGIDYDIIGLSYYPYYHKDFAQLESALGVLESNFPEKDIMIVAVGYNHIYSPKNQTFDYTATYPYTDAGQKAFTDGLIQKLEGHQQVKGLFWWMMEANECGLDWSTNRVTDEWYNAGLFDNATGKVRSALSSLKDFIGTTGIDGITQQPSSNTPHRIYSISGQKLSAPQRGINIINGKKVIWK